MRILFFIANIMLMFTHCVSRQELASIKQQVAEIKDENYSVKTETKGYIDSQKILKDTFLYLGPG